MIVAADDDFHIGSDHPYWNESALFMIQVPERNLDAFVYFYHRPNMKFSVGGVAVWDGSGEHMQDCLFYEWGRTVPLPDGARMFDFTLENGLSVRCDEPLNSYHVEYHGDGCDLVFDWTGIIPVQSHHGAATGSSALPGKSGEWGKGHYEQAGRAVGTLTVDSGEYTIDCWSARDRSWGQRSWISPRAFFPWAVASDQSAFQCIGYSPLDEADDPWVGMTDSVTTGWYLRDGVVSDLISGQRTVERGTDGRPVRVHIEATDSLGRTLDAIGVPQNWFVWTGYPHVWQWWCLAKWTFDGNEAWGEEQDMAPNHQFRRFARSRKGLDAAPERLV